jgi:ubiquinone/menaquinone biosynthesis C-methylase UbiE
MILPRWINNQIFGLYRRFFPRTSRMEKFMENAKSAQFNETATIRPVLPSYEKENPVEPYEDAYFSTHYAESIKAYLSDDRISIGIAHEYVRLVSLIGEKLGLGRTAKVLDIGCLCGVTVCALRYFGFEAYGIDFSQCFVSKAPKRVSPFIFKGDFTSIPFKENSFDIVVSWGTIEHLPETMTGMALSEAVRVAKNGGCVWIGCDNLPNDPFHLTNRPLRWWTKHFRKTTGQAINRSLRRKLANDREILKGGHYWNAVESIIVKA